MKIQVNGEILAYYNTSAWPSNCGYITLNVYASWGLKESYNPVLLIVDSISAIYSSHQAIIFSFMSPRYNIPLIKQNISKLYFVKKLHSGISKYGEGQGVVSMHMWNPSKRGVRHLSDVAKRYKLPIDSIEVIQ